MTTKTKAAQFTRGEERVYRFGNGTDLGSFSVTGVIEEVSENWVGFRYHNSEEIRTFGEHPQAIGTLDELKPVTR